MSARTEQLLGYAVTLAAAIASGDPEECECAIAHVRAAEEAAEAEEQLAERVRRDRRPAAYDAEINALSFRIADTDPDAPHYPDLLARHAALRAARYAEIGRRNAL